MVPRGKNRCGDSYYSWSSRESQERECRRMLQEVSLAKPVSLLTRLSIRLEIRGEMTRGVRRFNIDRCIPINPREKEARRNVSPRLLDRNCDTIYLSLA